MSNEQPLLLVTSFNKRLFEVTGKRLIKSFLVHKVDIKFLITYEDDLINDPIFPPGWKEKTNFSFYNLDQDIILKFWLDKYKHLIPINIGGTAPDCKCNIKTREDNWNGHKLGCPHSEWNRRASKWFRKIVALRQALSLNPEKIIFLDSDVYFLKGISLKYLNGLFKDYGLLYHLGEYRRKVLKTSIESGVIGFSKQNNGFEFLKAVINCFLTGEFQQYKRWDDGYIFRMLWEDWAKNKRLKSKDLVVRGRKTSHVVNLGVLANVFIHDKGHHLKYHKVT